ncbi:LysR family transcriptional regulator [Paracoccus saliphilus]|uniref:DNA-binding transcriptional regulator, LysR family n=1 Tax=Paracoccus saliphilus TaxID=405559 RepID=A0AA45W221_9RHOB|nr:LysR family transcriptional regulator [Paracoccus saliphilus]WCR01821.1 LysR family transcriptional regulator [Paracoccus saliphilus]SIS63804.1 DNA-binding transcriptional regulator, LysR family [Paracoccus saliphilus]
MAITFRQLRYFLVLAEELHFGRAAQKLHISQPPLSASLKQLEQTLGFALMERSHKAVRLTPAGIVYAEHARRILGQLDAAEALAAQAAKQVAGKITIGFVPSMLFRRLAETLREVQEAYPEIELRLHEMNTSRQVEALLAHRLDVGFVHSAPFPEAITEHVLGTERMLCCVPRDHPLAGRSRIRVSDLAGERVLIFAREFAPHFHDKIATLLQAADTEPFDGYRIQHWFTVVALVGQGMGISLVPQSLARSSFANVRYIEIEEAVAEHRISLIWRDENLTDTTRHFIRFVTGQADQF